VRLGYTTWGMQSVPAEDAIPILAGIGYDSVEITVVPGWRDELDALTPARRRRIKELLAEHGLALPALAGHRSLVAPDPAAHAQNWRALQAAIDLAAEWATAEGPPVLDTTAGGKPTEWDDVRGRLVERLARLCDYAAERGVTVAIEPHVSNALSTPERVLWLLGEVNRSNLKLTFDVSHFDVQGIPVEQSARMLAPASAFAHVKDVRGTAPDHEFLIPGEGEVDYVRYLAAMRAAGYDRDVCVEISLMVQRRPDFDPRRAAEQSYRVVSEAFERAGITRARGP
jgi:sugar phosphate isomerase/epimerase